MSLKVFQLAKELGVDSKAIVKKCQDEGVPKIDTHMSPVSAGLAETIREWFQAGVLHNAVESAAHVDLAKVKKKRVSHHKKAGGKDGETGGAEGATAVAELPAGETVESMEHAAQAVEVASETGVGVETPALEAAVASATEEQIAPTAETIQPSVAAPAGAEVAATLAPETPAAPTPSVPSAPESTEAGVGVLKPAATVAPAAPAPHVPAAPAPSVVHAPAVAAPVAAPAPHVAPGAPAAPRGPQVLQKPVRPTIMPMGKPNVPTRPAIISPVGQRVVPTPAQVAGPRVVRMEQPDNLPAPRPRPQMRQNTGTGGPVAAPRPAAGPGQPFTPPLPGATPSTGRARPTYGRGSGPDLVDDEEAAAAKRNANKARSSRRHGGRSADAGIVDPIREWREADLVDREERMSSAGGLLKERKRELSKTQQRQQAAHSPAQRPDHIEIVPPVTVRELSEAMGIKSSDVIKKLMQQEIMATVNQSLDGETAQMIALEFGVELVIKPRESQYQVLEREYKLKEEGTEKTLRPPVVTILGHVDHGKTSLLDKIRSAHVAAGEAGGITQHVGAYTVTITGSDGKEKRVTFLDTPGHQAFTAMRARGANMTDVIVLVVAADDGVMPQTIESIAHAKAAGVPIVVAMNKIDKADANPNKVLGQLAEQGLNPAEWGGDTEVVRTSAISGQGIKELIEYLDYVATLRDLKATPSLPARGAVIEAFMDPNRGVIARVLVQNGTLNIGDIVVCGPGSGRVRSIDDDKGKSIRTAGPATPVELIGLDEVPSAGDKFYVVDDVNEAKAIAEERLMADRAGEIAQRNKITLENLFDTIKKEDIKELRMILKADVQGSVDVLKTLMTEELSSEVKVRLLHAAVGGISESDVLLADASGAIIVGFSVVPDESARKLAEERGVEIRLYRIIYEITDDIRKALTGMLAPSKQDQLLGHAEVRQVIKVSRVGNVLGCMVTDGLLQRANKYRLIREGVVVQENLTLDSLKRFKEDVKEVRGGLECGIKLAGYDDVKVGDRIEAYKTVDVARSL